MVALVLVLALQDTDALLRELGSTDIAMRERAESALIDLGAKAEPALKNAAAGSDLEVRLRAQSILSLIALIRDFGLEALWKTSPALVRGLSGTSKKTEWIRILGHSAELLNSVQRRALAAPMLQDPEVLQHVWSLGKGGAGTRQDVWFCRAALESDHAEAAQAACLAIEKIAPLVPSKEGPDIGRLLAAKVPGKDGDASEFAVRAIARLADAEVLGDAVDECRKAGLRELQSADVEQRRRGANLLGGISGLLKGESADSAIEGLLKVAERRPTTEREVALYQMTLRALATFGGRAEGPKIREALAARYLEELAAKDRDRDWHFSTRYSALRGLGALTPYLAGELRRQTLKAIIESVHDQSLIFMATSGVRSPLRHHGAEVLAQVASALDESLRKEARAELEKAMEAEKDPEVRDALRSARDAIKP